MGRALPCVFMITYYELKQNVMTLKVVTLKVVYFFISPHIYTKSDLFSAWSHSYLIAERVDFSVCFSLLGKNLSSR